MKVQIHKVVPWATRKSRSWPVVFATVDGWQVKWRKHGWSCDCGDKECPHVDAVADLLDPSVTREDLPEEEKKR